MKKDVPVRHEDKETLRINKRFAMWRMLAGSIQNAGWLRLVRCRASQPRVPFHSTQPVPMQSEGLLLFNPVGVIGFSRRGL